jgi:(R,R)-butanediol dehydrogenase / meso-butanediol dehydrogenase / diacetyl reductase
MAEQMRAVVYHGPGQVHLEEWPVPEPRPGEVLLQITGAGVCGSDVGEYDHGPVLMATATRHPVTGHQGPLVMGHEFAGRVVALGAEVAGLRTGDLVASGAGVSCGACAACRIGRTNLCERYWTLGFHRDGGLAEYVAAPASVLARVDESAVAEDAAALTQPISIATHSMRRGDPAPGADVLTIGAGGVGAFLVAALRALTAVRTVVTIEPDMARRAVAAELGAEAYAPADAPEGRYPLVYEVSGTKAGFETAMASVSNGGRIVLIGLQQPWLRDSDLLRQISFRELELVGPNAHIFATDFADALSVVASRQDWSLIAPVVGGIELVPESLAASAAGARGPIKALFDPRTTGTRAARYR